MDKAAFILSNIYHLHSLAGRILDESGNPLALPFEGFGEQDPALSDRELSGLLREQGAQEAPAGSLAGGEAEKAPAGSLANRETEKAGDRYRMHNDGGYWYYVFHGRGRYVIWGPVVFEEHSKYDNRLYGKKRGVKGEICRIPLGNIWAMEETIAFGHGLLSEKYETGIEIDYGMAKERFQREISAKASEYGLQKAEHSRGHHSFARENQMWKWFVEGKADIDGTNILQMKTDNPFGDVIRGAGLMSESPRKNLEYAAVSGITLITRYAIAAGVEENVAYALSDVALQKLSKAADVMEIESTMVYTFQEFMRLGRNAVEKTDNNSRYVEQSREYIAAHIYEKLSVPEIAGAVGLHPVYLSRIFAGETGMTLMEYVMREKVQISCNLLKYSNRPIAVIAEYMNLSPQSYFTRVFKKVTGETPASYRKAHVDKNFLES